MPYIDLDSIQHDESEARQGDVDVYDHIMRHDVYHQHGRPVEPSDVENDGNQATQATEPNQLPTADVTSAASHVENTDLDTDMGNFIESELASGNTLDDMCASANSLLDEFEDPAEFPSDVD